ncbi:hypothetical protein CP960_07730 [Malaciobacter halophilus]|uniref:Lipoprotein n=1 Tax=Malaciobacter halophilus TaxID=197482 RepID=A0A2N1J310_9BACT|nr:hypothetical protein [Malaciobacter halophilus]AXH09789.1 hypothetical protein AHALO_1419 [Malaciobacter halophilus]PKI80884.1 hypothetical protein CP960_07730 [Malaciobacter halophilus]
MHKKILVSTTIALAILFTGCNSTKQKEVQTSKNENIKKEEVNLNKLYKIDEQKGYTFFKMQTNPIEVFIYDGDYQEKKILDDMKIKSSFYLKGRLLRIEKVYKTKYNDHYGKISKKGLFVSMDDLATYNSK